MATNPAPTELTADQMTGFADQLSEASISLFRFRLTKRLSADEQVDLRDLERRLDAMADVLRGRAIVLVVSDAQLKTAALKAAMTKANATLAQVKKIKDAIAQVTAILGLAGAVLTGDVKGIVAAVQGLGGNATA